MLYLTGALALDGLSRISTMQRSSPRHILLSLLAQSRALSDRCSPLTPDGQRLLDLRLLPLMAFLFDLIFNGLSLGQRLLLFGSNASEFTRSARARTLQLMRRVLLRRRADFARASRCDAHQESACGGGWALAVEG